MTQLANGKQFICSSCGSSSPNWGPCVVKGLGAGRGHDWEPVPGCMACEDTGYEAGMPGFYCTFCKAGYRVATVQMKAGRSPFDPHGEESDADKRRYENWGEGSMPNGGKAP